jgi:DNA helicase-2/ATP-dependent DNA helicase PcrA
LGFETDYPGTTVVKLEQNYRSTEAILDACNALVSHNTKRYPKHLWTDRGMGEPVLIEQATTPEEEADYVANELSAALDERSRLGGTAVVYRSNSQSRPLEEVFAGRGLPYRIIGGLRFYERRSVKDALAYFRLALNHRDNLAFERAIVNPSRGCGPKTKTMHAIEALAQEHGLALFEALLMWVQQSKPSKSVRRLSAFGDVIRAIGEKEDSVAEAVYVLQESSGLFERRTGRKGKSSPDANQESEDQSENQDIELDEDSRLENLAEFVHAVEAFEQRSADRSLKTYLSQAALAQDQDSLLNRRENEVVLVTAHSVKGLEFEYVFVVGVEDGLFPHYRSQSSTDIEEERRLLYVACTRARKRLWISYCTRRPAFGRGPDASATPEPSRFIGEMGEYVQHAQVSPYGICSTERGPGGRMQSGKSVDFIEGDMVMHHVFGAGRVLEVFYDGDDQFVVVDFKKKGVKKLEPKYAQLKKV